MIRQLPYPNISVSTLPYPLSLMNLTDVSAFPTLMGSQMRAASDPHRHLMMQFDGISCRRYGKDTNP